MKILRLESESNNYLVINELTDEALLIDCAGNADSLAAEILRRGLKLCGILLTHGHFDHIRCIDDVVRRFNCPFYVHALEQPFLERADLNLSVRLCGGEIEIEAKPCLLEESLQLAGFEIKVLHTPGHTPGSVCYQIGDCLFTGDTLFADSVGAEFPPYGNLQTEIDSIRRELFSLSKDYLCYPGHGESTSLFNERKSNMYCRL